MARSRKKVNQILPLETDEGTPITDDMGMRSIANNYFEERFEGKESISTPFRRV